MKLADLKKKGGVITDAFVKKPVEWTHTVKGKSVTEKFEIHVRRHAFGVMEAMFTAGEDEKYRNARYLSASVFLGSEGDEALPYDDAVNLDPALGVALLTAVNEVNAPAKN